MGRKGLGRVVAKTMELQRKVRKLQEKAASMARRGCSTSWREVLDEIESLLFDQ